MSITVGEGPGLCRIRRPGPERVVLPRVYHVTPRWRGRGIGHAWCSSPLLDRPVAEVAPHVDRIVSCVDQGDLPARRVHRTAGFAFTGTTIPGSAGPQDVMVHPLATTNPFRAAHAAPTNGEPQ
ncbi:GNAT family N-acetyltransferase [Nocardiopsis alkaliphila]|uniref:GNAT family N-acetyltransferase n=1 Tax=Nocardiopsis alkaliphila TaxID=225762 RepID=UPI000689150C|nr:GNAT family N-acetyltransferase [Nocardiopsis alkaliphila]